MGVLRRYLCQNYNGYGVYDSNCSSAWYDWGRWVALAVILVVAFLAFFLAALSARRRRRRGLQPWLGTRWMAGPPPPYAQYQQQPPQYYGGPAQGNPPENYYGGGRPNQENIELGQSPEIQQPPNAYYHSGVNYQPPPGPPPNKPKY